MQHATMPISRLCPCSGNFICIARLRFGGSKLNPTFSSLISWLALIDTLFLVFISLTFSLPSLSHEYKKWIFPVLLPSTLPLTSIFLTGNDILFLFFAPSGAQEMQMFVCSSICPSVCLFQVCLELSIFIFKWRDKNTNK